MTRSLSVRIDVHRSGARLCSLIPVGSPRAMMSDSGRIKTSLSVSVRKDERVDWLTDEICPVMIIDGVEHPVGVFLPSTVSDSISDSSVTDIEAYDRCWRCDTEKWLSTQVIGAGTNYLEAVEQLLTQCGISLVIKTPIASTIGTVRTWDAGTSYLDIINELLDEINYLPLWFNAEGYAMLQPQTIPTAATIAHLLDGNDVRSLLYPQMLKTQDIYNAPNVFTVICANADRRGIMSATAVNDNPSSPLSTVRRGRRIHSFTKVDNIADQATLEEYANLLRWESMGIGETVVATTALLPGFGLDDVVGLVYKDVNGIYISSGWTMELVTGGSMTHTLKRVVFAV